MRQPIYLVLENGTYMEGEAFGAQTHEAVGEAVFTTGMTGYLETLTDPSYYGQLVIQTFPLIGNYGVISSDFESKGVALCAYIVREWCHHPSNFRSCGDLDTFLKEKGIPGACGMDTRALTRIIRENGTMNAMLTRRKPPYGPEVLDRIRGFRCADPVQKAARQERELFPAPEARCRVVLWDFGAKQNMVRALNSRGCDVAVMPAASTAAELLAEKPDGLLLSNGPGDPRDNPEIIRELKEVLKSRVPVFGICLGHQLLALARGAETEKLKYGHRGGNQPVKDLRTGRVYITSQNHGYAVRCDSLPAGGSLRFVNLNDQSCEGIQYTDIPAFSVQFHPEACGGPRDTEYLFDQFIQSMKQN